MNTNLTWIFDQSSRRHAPVSFAGIVQKTASGYIVKRENGDRWAVNGNFDFAGVSFFVYDWRYQVR